MVAAGAVGRWTRYFAAASAVGTVALQVALLADASVRAVAAVGLFGAVLPMVFGMAYLLVPSYVGRTLSAGWLPGVHFVAACVGAVILASDALVGLDGPITAFGGVVWSVGIAVFVGTLLWTVAPALRAESRLNPGTVGQSSSATGLATAAIPVAVGYLLAGTAALLSTVTPLPALFGTGLPTVVHYYGVGFATLLVFALGARLLAGFFRVAPPGWLARAVLLSGVVAPGLLAPTLWRPPWFHVGAVLEAVAVLGYLALVGVVAVRTDRRRVGLYGVALGAAGGAVAVAVGLVLALGVDVGRPVAVHAALALDAFLLTTIVGYAYQFFPVTSGQFAGATRRCALATILLLAGGAGVYALGAALSLGSAEAVGATLALLGAVGYAYLLVHRVL
ncbi:hypothetical protein [Halomicrobium salinisoli]|uniref:hypothetical protein n=1 Tax=Halomicrobium salinisoli TaxID=2878391 RepID=UPI001CF0AC8D|nr:hypothetical protein [Halomicrobium salinisoli]